MTTVEPLAFTLGGRRYPVLLPRLSDARLHTAAVVLTIHALGQLAFGFAVSVPQIAAGILTAAAIETLVVLRTQQRLAWPASAMLTGSGIGLILRVEGTSPGQHWSTHRWWWFALVAGGSLLTKYLLRWQGRPLFNPSNVGLVATFLLLGVDQVEPLDLWWHSWGAPLALAYAVIVAGGTLITARLRLLGLVTACWLTLVAGLAVLAQSGHCIATNRTIVPVCDWSFWWLFVSSPEILIFVFFMVSDPRTVPASRWGRLAFGTAVGALATVLLAPRTSEFGAKVALLGALTLVCGARPLLARSSSAQPGFDRLLAAVARQSRVAVADVRGAALGIGLVASGAVLAVALTTLGEPARRAVAAPIELADLPDLDELVAWTEPSVLPSTSVDDLALMFGAELATPEGQRQVVTGLLHTLAAEAEALRLRRPEWLPATAHGAHLQTLRKTLERAADAPIEVTRFRFDDVQLTAVRRRGQSGAVLGARASGTATIDTVDTQGRLVTTRTEAVDQVFGLRQSTDGRWLIVHRQPADTPPAAVPPGD